MNPNFDFSKLRGKIVEKFGSQNEFAVALGQSSTTLSRKMQNKVHFSADDIVTVANLLEIPADEIGAYFFAVKV